jgi:serine/threonine-protein kinase
VLDLLGLGRILLEQRQPAEALPLIERALKLAPENLRAESQFTHAQALWDANRDRKRALALATQAREEWQRLGRKSDAEQISQWLEERTRPPARPSRSKKRSKR